MEQRVPRSELDRRMKRFRDLMETAHPGWELAAIISRVNLYYLCGTIQDALLLVPRDDDACLFVRKSYERARNESLFPHIRPMQSYRDAAVLFPSVPDTVYLETEQVPLAVYSRLQKHLPFRQAEAIDRQLLQLRATKSPYEIRLMEAAGKIHRVVLEERTPGVLREGMSEAAFAAELYRLMIEEGHHGIVRFGRSETDIVLGLVGFGESSLVPTSLDSPSGNAGMSPAAPLCGSHQRKLCRGDLVFVDCGAGYQGYHTDKTMTYVFRGTLPREAESLHQRCREIEETLASLLKPGAIPSEIYATLMAGLEPSFLEHFMGYGEATVQYLGHGVGLEIAEHPVIARGFDQPLEEGMTIALEPKKGIRGIGMVGTENTYLVTRDGCRSITGTHPGLMPVG